MNPALALNHFALSPLMCVVDIETFGKKEDAIIATIGAVIVDVHKREITNTFYIRATTEDQKNRSWDPDVMQFWENQKQLSPQAFDEVFSRDLPRGTLKHCLESFSEFIKFSFPKGVKPQVMGNGPEFDNRILSHAYETESVEQAWHFGNNQSLRTAVWFGRLFLNMDPKYQTSFVGSRHHALDDAKHEANYLLAITNELQDRLKNDK